MSNPLLGFASRMLKAGGEFAKARGGGFSQFAQFPAAVLSETAATSVMLVANHLLAQQRNATERLSAEAGKVVVFQVSPFTLGFRITDQGYLKVSRQSGVPVSTADTTISVQWADLLGSVPNPSQVSRKANITGDLEFAQIISGVVMDLHWDPEQDLARVLGDAQAVWIMNSLSAAGTSLQDVITRLKANLREYVVFEKGLTPTASEFERFRHEVGQLRDDLARLEKRVTRADQGASTK